MSAINIILIKKNKIFFNITFRSFQNWTSFI